MLLFLLYRYEQFVALDSVHFSGPSRALGRVCVSGQKLLNYMTPKYNMLTYLDPTLSTCILRQSKLQVGLRDNDKSISF